MEASIRQVADRNQFLESENAKYYKKLHSLLTEITALKAARSQIADECKSFVEVQRSMRISPTKGLESKISDQSKRIEELGQQSEAIIDYKRQIAKSKQSKAEVISEVQKAVSKFKEETKDMDIIPPETFPTCLSEIEAIIDSAGSRCLAITGEKSALDTQFNEKSERFSDLESQITILEADSSSMKDCSERYGKEREELTAAVSSLRSSLAQLREKLISSENERTRLKIENSRLKASIVSTS